jgi:hypothetical protein
MLGNERLRQHRLARMNTKSVFIRANPWLNHARVNIRNSH